MFSLKFSPWEGTHLILAVSLRPEFHQQPAACCADEGSVEVQLPQPLGCV